MRICVIGLGKLGLPVASAFRSQGFDVVGVDTNEALIQSLQDRTFTTYEPNVSLDGIDYKTQVPTNCAAAFICVPTPSKPDGAFDDKYVRAAVEAASFDNNPVIVIVSTLMPGQTRAISKECQSEICYSPTFIALGSVVADFLDADVRIIGEESRDAGDFLERIYDKLPFSPVKRMSFESAEIAKLATNCYVTTKIAYANQLQMLCEATPNADVDDVTEAMGLDYRIGKHYLKAGMPFGGPCFPRDVLAMNSTRFVTSGIRSSNERHANNLRSFIPMTSTNKTILLGTSYKVGASVEDEQIFWGFRSNDVSEVTKADVVIVCTQDPRWLQGDYRDKIVFDPWGYFKEHGVVCKQLITPGRRR